MNIYIIIHLAVYFMKYSAPIDYVFTIKKDMKLLIMKKTTEGESF